MSRFALLLLLSAASLPARGVVPHPSFDKFPTGNGHTFAIYDAGAGKLVALTEHPYAQAAPGQQTRNLAYDAYFGVRASGAAAWLSERPVDSTEYAEQSHVVRVLQSLGPLSAQTHVFAPWGLAAPAVALVLHVRNESRLPVTDAAIYSLLNFHLGSGPVPGTDGEHIEWDAGTQSFAESGPSGVTLRYVPFGGPVLHGASPQNPYAIAKAGGDFANVDSTGVRADAIAGFEWQLDPLAAADERWVGVVVTLGSAADARAWIANRGAAQVVQDELDAWRSWRVAPPAGLSPAELRTFRQSETVLRLAQSREPAPSAGQIVAALPPGQWSMSWVRDMAYATSALARLGHAREASAAVDFWKGGRVGQYKQFAGGDYLVSVVRYYGDGEEWSDSNQDGPNIEFDGFGLAAWAAREAGRSEMDGNAAPLQRLTDSTGLIAADSSIWERHWNGKQKHFAYTSIAAAAGLCAAGQPAAARALRDSIEQKLTLPSGGLASSLEQLQAQAAAVDGSSVEAVNLGLIDPQGPLSLATLQQLEALRTQAGRGYFRNQDGGGYDSQEWVFVDLRASAALRRAGRVAQADELLAWVTQQADQNHGLLAELYDHATADYAGATPMVGFGAGAYVLALLDRAQAAARPACFVDAPPAAQKRSGCASAQGAAWAAAVAAALVGARNGKRARARARQKRTHDASTPVAGGQQGRAHARSQKRAHARSIGRSAARNSVAAVLAAVALALFAGCGSGGRAAPDAGAGPDAGADGGGLQSVLGPPFRDCSTSFVYNLGHGASRVSVAGEWNNFSLSADPMTDPLGTGTYRANLVLPPGDYGYKLVADGTYALDPSNGLTKWVNGVENSRLVVEDCNQPALRVTHSVVTADKAIALTLAAVDGAGRAGLDPASLLITVDGAAAPGVGALDLPSGTLTVRAPGLSDGKHTLRVDLKDANGRAARQLIVPMWIEAEPFQWSDGPLYLAFVDRFRNGDPGNDRPVPNVDPRANYQGGDLAGVLAALREGYFQQLGVRTIWLSPLNQGPGGAFPGLDGRTYTDYHGYWSAAPRAVEPRLGSMADLKALTAEAHKRGVRIVLDLVQNDLHQEHPYYAAHAHDGWFHDNPDCICGGASCDYAGHGLFCWFTSYLPDVNYTNAATTDQMTEDALYWLTEADVDGFRVDAVKQMEHTAMSTLRNRVVSRLEGGNQKYLLLGETFDGDRNLIMSYVSPRELTGQFDFPLYFAIDSVVAAGNGSMADLDGAVLAGEAAYGGNVMSPFFGNHDVPRFLTRANHDVAGNAQEQAWTNPPVAPDTDPPWQRLLLAQAFVLTQPGLPLLYYGDEIGLAGTADPDNRRMMRFGSQLSARESGLLAKVRALGVARATHPGLRRGARRTLWVDSDTYVYARGTGADFALVALNRAGSARQLHVPLPQELSAQGATLRDVLGGPSVTAGADAVDLTLPALTAAVWLR